MAKVTLFFAFLLAALGLAGYVGTGSAHMTALIPFWFGLALGLFGWLAISPDERRRRLFMHIAVTVGLVAFLGGAAEAIRGYVHATGLGEQPNMTALASKLAMAGLMLVYVGLCVRSFIAARREGKV